MAQTQVVRGVKTSIRTENGQTVVTYRGTDVVRFSPDRVELNTGGWRSNTTKTRMNQAANQFSLGYGVFQKDWEWYVSTDAGTFAFEGDRMTIDRATGRPC